MEQSGEPDNFQALWPLLKGFLFFMNYFTEKEGFLRFMSYI